MRAYLQIPLIGRHSGSCPPAVSAPAVVFRKVPAAFLLLAALGVAGCSPDPIAVYAQDAEPVADAVVRDDAAPPDADYTTPFEGGEPVAPVSCEALQPAALTVDTPVTVQFAAQRRAFEDVEVPSAAPPVAGLSQAMPGNGFKVEDPVSLGYDTFVAFTASEAGTYAFDVVPDPPTAGRRARVSAFSECSQPFAERGAVVTTLAGGRLVAPVRAGETLHLRLANMLRGALRDDRAVLVDGGLKVSATQLTGRAEGETCGEAGLVCAAPLECLGDLEGARCGADRAPVILGAHLGFRGDEGRATAMVRIHAPDSAVILAGAALRWPGSDHVAYATRIDADGPCQEACDVALTFDRASLLLGPDGRNPLRPERAVIGVANRLGAWSMTHVTVAVEENRIAGAGEWCDPTGVLRRCTQGTACLRTEGTRSLWVCDAEAVDCDRLGVDYDFNTFPPRGGRYTARLSIDGGSTPLSGCEGAGSQQKVLRFTAPAADRYVVSVRVDTDAFGLAVRRSCDSSPREYGAVCAGQYQFVTLRANETIWPVVYFNPQRGRSAQVTIAPVTVHDAPVAAVVMTDPRTDRIEARVDFPDDVLPEAFTMRLGTEDGRWFDLNELGTGPGWRSIPGTPGGYWNLLRVHPALAGVQFTRALAGLFDVEGAVVEAPIRPLRNARRNGACRSGSVAFDGSYVLCEDGQYCAGRGDTGSEQCRPASWTLGDAVAAQYVGETDTGAVVFGTADRAGLRGERPQVRVLGTASGAEPEEQVGLLSATYLSTCGDRSDRSTFFWSGPVDRRSVVGAVVEPVANAGLERAGEAVTVGLSSPVGGALSEPCAYVGGFLVPCGAGLVCARTGTSSVEGITGRCAAPTPPTQAAGLLRPLATGGLRLSVWGTDAEGDTPGLSVAFDGAEALPERSPDTFVVGAQNTFLLTADFPDAPEDAVEAAVRLSSGGQVLDLAHAPVARTLRIQPRDADCLADAGDTCETGLVCAASRGSLRATCVKPQLHIERLRREPTVPGDPTFNMRLEVYAIGTTPELARFIFQAEGAPEPINVELPLTTGVVSSDRIAYALAVPEQVPGEDGVIPALSSVQIEASGVDPAAMAVDEQPDVVLAAGAVCFPNAGVGTCVAGTFCVDPAADDADQTYVCVSEDEIACPE